MSEGTPEGSQGHPAWQELLDKIPEDLHPLITPELEKFDKHSQGLVQGLHEKYDPYKPFVEEQIDPQILQQSLYLANHLQTDPEDFIRKAIENFGLEEVVAAFANDEEEEEEEMEEYDGDDISNHPQFKALLETVNTLNSQVTQRTQAEQAEQEQRELDEFLEGLQAEKGSFDKLYVSALMANGVDAEEAVGMYHKTIEDAILARSGQNNGQQNNGQQTTAPVVMGGAGTAGSGSEAEPVQMGKLKSGEVSDLVAQMVENMKNQQ